MATTTQEFIQCRPVTDREVDDLRNNFRGGIWRPGDTGYDDLRKVWNGTVDRRPALILRCSGTADVIAAVNFARTAGIPAAIRGGGHSFSGASMCDGGIVIDVSQMRGIWVDPDTRRVKAQPGVTWAMLDRETQAFGLAVPGGLISHTGIAGLTLGGGIGWLMRKHGLTIDNLLSVDIVTADGKFLHATFGENPDLFWAVRGGGGNFGVVTSFEFQLHRVGPIIFGGMLLWPFSAAPDVLQTYREWAANLPDETTSLVAIFTAPPAPFVPPELQGKLVIAAALCHAGPVTEGEKIAAPLREAVTPAVDLLGPMPYTALQGMLDETAPPGLRYYVKSSFMKSLEDSAFSTILEQAAKITSPLTQIHVQHMGGQVSRIRDGETAFGDRSPVFAMTWLSIWERAEEGAEPHIQWARNAWNAIKPYSSSGVYVNFLSAGEGEDAVHAAYGNKYRRLVEIKRRYDPQNIFRFNQNISPELPQQVKAA